MTTTPVTETPTAHVADVIAYAYRVTRTQAMVAFQRGETVLIAERSLPTVPVTARTTTHDNTRTHWGALSDHVDAWSNRHPTQTWYVVVPELDADGNAWPLAYTVNNRRIVPGLRVRDYDRRETTVTAERPSLSGPLGTERTPWFHTANGGLFDGSRLSALD